MNIVEQIFASISDSELKAAVAEMKQYQNSGILPEGTVRTLAKRLQDEAGLSGHDARRLSESEVYRLAAFKWAGV